MYYKMSDVTSTIWELEPHTEAKHAILRKYLDAWIPILTKHHRRVIFIDGFAGPGEYKGGEDGSPVIAIKSVIEHKIKIQSEIVFLFVENDKKRFEFLEGKLKKMSLPGNIKYECKNGEFAEVVGGILDELSKTGGNIAPTFVFIDPFGFKGFPYNLISKIMENEGCEVLVNFMFEEITRFIELPQNESVCTLLFGTEKWKEVKGKKGEERLKFLHELYKEQLRKLAKYVVSFKMVNKFNKEDYFLFFATNHILGLKKMKESMWRIDPKGKFEFSDATYDPYQTVLFELEPNFTFLKKLILKEYGGKKVSVDELENFIVVETPFRETHYKTRVLNPMEKNGEIKVVSGNRSRAGTYPSGTIIEFL